MRGQSVSVVAAALLAAAPAAFAGNARIHNYCDFNVYSWSVDTEQNPSESTVIEAGGMYQEAFRKPASGGVSIKLSPTNDVYVPITQLEYTLNADLWYDVSNVDCTGTACPFQKHGLYLESGPSCPTVSCEAGNLTCHGAYTLWDDNWASLCCTDPDPDIVLYLCTSKPGKSSPPPAPVQHYHPEPPRESYYPPSTSSTPTPTHYEPYTSVVAVTEYATKVVTIQPTPDSDSYDSSDDTDSYRMRRRRHMHNHMNAHRH